MKKVTVSVALPIAALLLTACGDTRTPAAEPTATVTAAGSAMDCYDLVSGVTKVSGWVTDRATTVPDIMDRAVTAASKSEAAAHRTDWQAMGDVAFAYAQLEDDARHIDRTVCAQAAPSFNLAFDKMEEYYRLSWKSAATYYDAFDDLDPDKMDEAIRLLKDAQAANGLVTGYIKAGNADLDRFGVR